MTQPSAPAPTPSSAPPAPTSTPPAQPAPTGQPSGTPVPPQPQQPQAWPQQGYQPTPQPPVQYVPVMPIPQTIAAAPAADGDGSGEDLSKLPQWAQKKMQALNDENAKRRISERTAVVNQHAWVAAQQLGVNGQALFGSLAWQRAAEQLDPSKPDFGRHLAETIYNTLRDNPWMAQQAAYPPAPGQPPAAGQPGQQPPTSGQPAPPGQPPQPGAVPGQPPSPPSPYAPQPYPGAYPMPYGQPGYPPPGVPAPPGAYPGMPGYGWPPRPAAPPTSGGEFAAGNSAGAPITEAQLAQMTPEQIEKALNEGKLAHLM